MGIGDSKWREIKDQLQTKFGKKRYVIGSAWLAFIARAAELKKEETPSEKLADGDRAG